MTHDIQGDGDRAAKDQVGGDETAAASGVPVGDVFDAVVIGGGAAGLSGALMLARSRRSVVVVDSGAPRNAPADGVHGLLGHDGVSPLDLLERGRAEVRGYGGHVLSGEVTSVQGGGEAGPALGGERERFFAVTLADGRVLRARRLLVTSGLVDELPDVGGLRERWGRDVVHCPYCHGWEVRDRAIGVLGTGPMSVHQALLFRQLSDDVVFFTHTAPPLSPEQREQFDAVGIRVVEGKAEALEVDADRVRDVGRIRDGADRVRDVGRIRDGADRVGDVDRIRGVRLGDGTVVARDAIAVATRMVGRTGFLRDLGLLPVEHPMGIGEHLVVDPQTGRTAVPGVWAAGNVTDPSAQVGAASAAGALAGAQINFDLVTEDVNRAVEAKRSARM